MWILRPRNRVLGILDSSKMMVGVCDIFEILYLFWFFPLQGLLSKTARRFWHCGVTSCTRILLANITAVVKDASSRNMALVPARYRLAEDLFMFTCVK